MPARRAPAGARHHRRSALLAVAGPHDGTLQPQRAKTPARSGRSINPLADPPGLYPRARLGRPGAVEKLKTVGMESRSADDDTSVVEGSIDSCRLEELEKLDCVDYVRKVFSYDANYPPGDPRDRDGV